jgi:hypothetical protein
VPIVSKGGSIATAPRSIHRSAWKANSRNFVPLGSQKLA